MRTLLDNPIIEILDYPLAKIVEPFSYTTTDGLCVKIPDGFITDGASIPRPFRSIIASWGDHANAAVVHDYVSRYKIRSRRECDKIFLEAMTELGVNKIKKYTMYYSVRLFGWISWGKISKRVL